MRRWASAAFSRGKARSITGFTLPASSNGQRLSCRARDSRSFSSGERARSVEPVKVRRLSIRRIQSTSTFEACRKAIWTSRPSTARLFRLRSMYGPPTMSRITSTPWPSVRRETSTMKSRRR